MDAHKTLIVFIQGVGALLLLSLVECQIISSPDSQTTCSGKDVDLEWVYGNPNDFASVTWTYINSSLVETTIMEQSVGGGAAQALNNFSVEHHGNGAITLKNVDTGKSGSYKISVAYLSSSPVDNTVSVTVNDCSSTTVPPTAPTTSTPTSSTTIKSPVVIIALSVGGAAIVILIICIIVCILLRKTIDRKKKYRADPENKEMTQVDINVTKQQ